MITDELAAVAHPELRDELAEPNARLGVAMGDVFRIGKSNIECSDEEIAQLLRSKWHEARVTAVSIMDFLARARRTPTDRRKALV
jgi:hypothetical protein